MGKAHKNTNAVKVVNDENLPLAVDLDSVPAIDEKKSFFGRLLGRAIYIPVLMGLLFTGGVIGVYFQPPGLQRFFELTGLVPGAGTNNPIALPLEVQNKNREEELATRPTDVVALGRILPKDDIVTVSTPFGAGDARVAEILVDEGSVVKKGDVVAILDNLSNLKSRLISAEASVELQRANLDQAKTSIGASRASAEATLAKAKSVASNAKNELERSQKLFETRVVTKAYLEKAEAAYEQALRDVESAEATLNRYIFENINTQPDVIVALRNLEAAKAEYDRAERDLSQAYVRSPSDGTVIKMHVRPGEKPGQKGIAEIGNLNAMIVEAEVYQTLIGKVKIGQKAEITALAFDEPLSGTVVKIGLEVGKQSIVDDDPAANTDARIIIVTVLLDDNATVIASRFTNLEVVTRIKAGGDPD